MNKFPVIPNLIISLCILCLSYSNCTASQAAKSSADKHKMDSLRRLVQKNIARGNLFQSGNNYLDIGFLYHSKVPDSALYFYKLAFDQYISSGDSTNLAKCYLNIGMILKKQGLYQKAHQHLTLSSQINKDNKAVLASTYNSFGSLYNKTDITDEAINYYRRALLEYRLLGDTVNVFKVSGNMATIFTKMHLYDSALSYYQVSYEMKKAYGDQAGMSATLNNIGWMYLEKQDLEKAEEFLLKAYEMKLSINEMININKTMNQLGELYLRKRNYQKAYKFLSMAYDIASGNNLRKDEREILINLSRYYEAIENKTKQVEMLKEYIMIDDSLMTAEKLRAFQNSESSFKDQQITVARQIENTLRSRVQNLDNYLIWTFAGLVILSLTISIAVIFIIKFRKSSLLNYHLKQENQHSIKNHLQTLSSILSMQHRELEDLQAKKALKDSRNRLNAINLIHQLLYEENNHEQQIRFDQYMHNLADAIKNSYRTENTNIEIDIRESDKLVSADLMLNIGLLLNELVTNSFKHGTGYGNHGEIRIKTEIVDDATIFVEVRDSGEGLPEGVLPKKDSSFGSRLIDILSKQLNAQKRIFNDQGAVFQFSIPFTK